MKVRKGFVSNSSSSSFIVLITKEAYDEIIKDIDPFAQAVVEQLSGKTQFLGTECVSYNHTSGNYTDFEWLSKDKCIKRAKEIAKETGKEFYEEDIEWCDWEILCDFEEKVGNVKDKAFTHSIDF